jgi:hypothetical protein
MNTPYKSILAVLLALSVNALALNTTTINWAPNHSPEGGEFILDPSDGDAFNSFCIEKNEYVTPGGTYLYSVSDRTDNSPPAGGDPISIGTAWLYRSFRDGSLVGYSATSTFNQTALQDLFWYLEGEITGEQLRYRSSLDYYSLALAANPGVDLFSDANGAFDVVVWNLTDLNGGRAQSQLAISTPEGGSTLALAGLGMAGMLFLRRR